MPRIFLWYVPTSDVQKPDLIARCQALLLADERAQHGRFVRDLHRHEYLVTRALARGVLGKHLGVAPSALGFVRNAYGRPELTPPSSLRFNLTNSTRLIACGVTEGAELGIDTEPLDRATQIMGIAETVFTSAERRFLDARRAVELWTLKEAYMKARGMGMSLPVLSFEFVGTKLRVMPPIEDDASRWEVSTRQVEDHLVSVCVEHRGEPVEVEVRKADLEQLI